MSIVNILNSSKKIKKESAIYQDYSQVNDVSSNKLFILDGDEYDSNNYLLKEENQLVKEMITIVPENNQIDVDAIESIAAHDQIHNGSVDKQTSLGKANNVNLVN